MGAFLMPNHLDHFKGPLKEVLNNSDQVAKKAKPVKPKPRVLPKSEYKSNKLNKYGINPRDFEVLGDQSAGLPKPQFRDEKSDLSYHQFNGQDKESQFANRDKKNQRELNRSKRGQIQTKDEAKGTFFKGREQRVDTHAHHVAPVKALGFLFDGLKPDEARRMIDHFEKRGVYVGNDPRNRADLDGTQHISVHDDYVKKGILKYNHKSLAGMSLKDRIKFANVLIQEIKEAKKSVEEVMYSGSFLHEGYEESFNF